MPVGVMIEIGSGIDRILLVIMRMIVARFHQVSIDVVILLTAVAAAVFDRRFSLGIIRVVALWTLRTVSSWVPARRHVDRIRIHCVHK